MPSDRFLDLRFPFSRIKRERERERERKGEKKGKTKNDGTDRPRLKVRLFTVAVAARNLIAGQRNPKTGRSCGKMRARSPAS